MFKALLKIPALLAILLLAMFIFWTPQAEACPPGAAARASSLVRGYYGVTPQFFVQTPTVIPLPMQATSTDSTLELRVTALEKRADAVEKAIDDAGRSLLFRTRANVATAGQPTILTQPAVYVTASAVPRFRAFSSCVTTTTTTVRTTSSGGHGFRVADAARNAVQRAASATRSVVRAALPPYGCRR